MGNSSSGAAIVAAAFLVGAAIGYAIGKGSKVDRCHTKSDHNVVVALDGGLDCPEVVIGPQNSVSWQAPSGTTLSVTYQGGSVFNSHFCGGNACYSGRPAIVWGPTEKRKIIDYTLRITGGTQPAPTMGRIIIDK
jgi:hypothetical protein